MESYLSSPIRLHGLDVTVLPEFQKPTPFRLIEQKPARINSTQFQKVSVGGSILCEAKNSAYMTTLTKGRQLWLA